MQNEEVLGKINRGLSDERGFWCGPFQQLEGGRLLHQVV